MVANNYFLLAAMAIVTMVTAALRDASLLTQLPNASRAWLAYAMLQLLLGAALGNLAERISPALVQQKANDFAALALLLAPSLLSIGLYLGLEKRSKTWAGLVGLIPTPFQLFCFGLLCWSLLQDVRFAGWQVGLALMSFLLCLTFLGKYLRLGWHRNLLLAAQLPCLAILPTSSPQPTGGTAPPASQQDWLATGLPLLLTLSLTAASFLFFRARGTPYRHSPAKGQP